MVSSTSTSNVGLKVCTTWALMGQAQIPTLSHQNLDHNITEPAVSTPAEVGVLELNLGLTVTGMF